jgi:3-deoxy-D-manno-octulosonic-acid transferase
MRRLLSSFQILACQTESYSERLRALGAPSDRVVVTGNIKFDRVQSDRENAKTRELRTAFNIAPTERVLIAGSTQDPEEAYAIDAWLALSSDFSNLRLIIVPRHKERFDEVAALIRQKGCSLLRRTEVKPSETAPATGPTSDHSIKPPVLLLDTLGELAACWGLADVAFVGGSLTNRGGQNMIEPAGYGAAVLFGPNTWNFKDIAESLLSRQAAQVVNGPEELRETVRRLLQHPDELQRMGIAASKFVSSQQGATARTLDMIAKIVSQKGRYESPASDVTSA